ncbi:Beta-hydroxyacyl-(acyl-carrier-protein) dehydratase FabZ [Streptococcus suis GZ1]|uniref:Beta-hydroxyacyl-(Acyl-carrier-protein) dehydratase FabZ n=1 Tax=Streptococcus suis (strain GZ1) TaxID=423211 RepID=D5AJR1_STRGZ|nr:Beta-hydroxyacyl-(acyl-carrier-protein) dehydratase FabZ [Streptococcus suis GZ1]
MSLLQWAFPRLSCHARCSHHGGLAQTAGVLELSKEENKGKLVFYAGMDKVKFKKQVVPGDQLIMTAKFVKRRGTIAVVEAKAEVEGKLAASGTLTFAIGK